MSSTLRASWALCFAALACRATEQTIATDWFDLTEIHRLYHDFSRTILPRPYEKVLQVIGPAEVQHRLRIHTQLSPHLPNAQGFVSRILLTDPGAEQGYFTLELSGSASAKAAPADRTARAITLFLHQPRGRVTGPMICDTGYRHFVMRGTYREYVDEELGIKGPRNYRWLDPSVVNQVEDRLRALKPPARWTEVVTLLAPADASRELRVHRAIVAGVGGLVGGMVLISPPQSLPGSRVTIDFTDPASPAGYYSLYLASADSFESKVEKLKFDNVVLQYHLPASKTVVAVESGLSGRRVFEFFDLDMKRTE
jgi:hypothetical protein